MSFSPGPWWKFVSNAYPRLCIEDVMTGTSTECIDDICLLLRRSARLWFLFFDVNKSASNSVDINLNRIVREDVREDVREEDARAAADAAFDVRELFVRLSWRFSCCSWDCRMKLFNFLNVKYEVFSEESSSWDGAKNTSSFCWWWSWYKPRVLGFFFLLSWTNCL